jgi:hypothetical protein
MPLERGNSRASDMYFPIPRLEFDPMWLFSA